MPLVNVRMLRAYLELLRSRRPLGVRELQLVGLVKPWRGLLIDWKVRWLG
mgnify:CR=1 FL=1